MIWKNNPTVEGLNAIQQGTICSHLDIKFTEVGEDYLAASMPVDQRTKQPMGLLHGGASAVLAETLGSVASVITFDDPTKQSIVGIEINANHLKSAKSGHVYGKVKPIRIGKKLHVWNIEITDDVGHLVCVSRLTVMVIHLVTPK
ncbi:MAG: hotdog fold thioesterase [Saprospiraceae bacterium]|nr:hotdog fold thioesterase [Bacteroidia bacterium]NNE13918.1 hotdog fold thioesterase [Saprospiraceae bacterium]NNL91293.1 hotdog fold thioesterase [Saprospiraceae bacterium]